MLRTFNRHQVKKLQYPSLRFYMVPVDCAEELSKAIVAAAAASGRQRGRGLAKIHLTPSQGSMPEWYADFEK